MSQIEHHAKPFAPRPVNPIFQQPHATQAHQSHPAPQSHSPSHAPTSAGHPLHPAVHSAPAPHGAPVHPALANHGAWRAPTIPSHSPVHPVSALDRHLGVGGIASDVWSLSQSTNPFDAAINTGKTVADTGSLLTQATKPLMSAKLGAVSNGLSAISDTRAALDPHNPGITRSISGAQAALDVASMVSPQAAAVNGAWGGGNAIGQGLNLLSGTVDKATGGDGSNTLSGMLDKGIDHLDPQHRFGKALTHIGF